MKTKEVRTHEQKQHTHGPKVENPGKMLGRLLGYIMKTYKFHIVAVVIFIFVNIVPCTLARTLTKMKITTATI